MLSFFCILESLLAFFLRPHLEHQWYSLRFGPWHPPFLFYSHSCLQLQELFVYWWHKISSSFFKISSSNCSLLPQTHILITYYCLLDNNLQVYERGLFLAYWNLFVPLPIIFISSWQHVVPQTEIFRVIYSITFSLLYIHQILLMLLLNNSKVHPLLSIPTAITLLPVLVRFHLNYHNSFKFISLPSFLPSF